MKNPANIYDYLRAYDPYFYTWEDEGEVLAIPNGKTICYRDFLFEVLTSLADQGIPSLGALLLVIIATADDGGEMLAQVQTIFRAATMPRHETSGKFFETEEFLGIFRFLTRISELPQRYRNGRNKLLLLQTIFEASHNLIARATANRLILSTKAGWNVAELKRPQLLTPGIYHYHLHSLSLLANKYPNSDALLKKLLMVPQLEELPFDPEPNPVTIPPPPKDFIDSIAGNPLTFHVGTLVRHIWSGLHIPFHNNHPGLQPLGGISDLSNKGEIDKLLISEYAHDDLLFLSRLANREALYINREVPPENERLQRILLIDSSLQTWGTPRTLAYALFIAIQQHPKTDIECIGYGVGKAHTPVSCGTIDELMESLHFLDTGINAAAGLEAFLKNGLPKGKQELFFITSPQGMKQPAVQKVLSEQQKLFSYCITAGETGEITIYKKGGTGLKLLQSFILPLAKLWANQPQTATPKTLVDLNPAGLPASYPILFPNPEHVTRLLTADGQLFAITEERSILQKVKSGRDFGERGWRHLLGDLPGGHASCEIGKTDAGDFHFLHYAWQDRKLYIFNLSTRQKDELVVDSWIDTPNRADFIFWKDTFILVTKNRLFEFKLEAGNTSITKKDSVPDSINKEKVRRHLVLNSLKKDWPLTGSIIKNLKAATIDEHGVLYISNHMLFQDMTPGASRFWRLGSERRSPATGVTAARADKNKLVFPDGSAITINKNGIFILESSNPDLATIYIPALLDASLGFATKDYYAGPLFFWPGNIPEQKQMEVADFYATFINPFITRIMVHEAINKTHK